MFLARREFGKIARVYQVVAPFLHPRAWTFPGAAVTSPLFYTCGAGHCAIGRSRAEALGLLQGNDDIAADEVLG